MKHTVQIRLVGTEEAVRAAIVELEGNLGVRCQIPPPRKGRKGDEWLAYGTLVAPDTNIPTTSAAVQAYTGVTRRLGRRKPEETGGNP